MLKVYTLAFCIFITTLSYCQVNTVGFYIILKNESTCRLTLRTLDRKDTYCVSERPIIGVSEFETVGDIKYDTILYAKYFNVKLSQKGFTTWKAVMERLPGTKLALVSNDIIFAVFEKLDGALLHTISISGPLYSVEIDLIQKELKKKKSD